jgi:hypothetical protein
MGIRHVNLTTSEETLLGYITKADRLYISYNCSRDIRIFFPLITYLHAYTSGLWVVISPLLLLEIRGEIIHYRLSQRPILIETRMSRRDEDVLTIYPVYSAAWSVSDEYQYELKSGYLQLRTSLWHYISEIYPAKASTSCSLSGKID